MIDKSLENVRDKTLDVFKEISIFLVVVGHAGCHAELYRFIYLFHMAAFFILAGCFYRSAEDGRDNIRAVVTYCWRRIKRLWWPYVFWGCAFVLSWNRLIGCGLVSGEPYSQHELVYRLIRVFPLWQGCGNLAGAFWFLRSMFYAFCLYRLVEYAIERLNLHR